MTEAVEARAFAAFDRRLDRQSLRPLAVAVSGGGDSTALLHLADAWARGAGRALHVLTVDHGLQPQSAAWTRFVREAAGRLGRPAEVLRWTGAKPTTGLPAAARHARHALLAEAARRAGARVVLTGHTADDELEAEQMRREGSTLGALREWTPSPAWPEGRGVFLLRPLMEVRRAALRVWLAERGLDWVEDPANEDIRFARVRARKHLSVRPPGGGSPGVSPTVQKKSSGARLRGDDRERAADRFGAISLSRAALRPGTEVHAAVSAALLCAGGGARPPRGHALNALVERLRSDEAFTATLAGARVEAGPERAVFGRNAGERSRGGLAPVATVPGRAVVWDGRFEVNAAGPGIVRALAGSASRLPRAEREALKPVPAWLRPALPVLETASGGVFCPLFTMPEQARSLVGERWLAACGAVTREQEIPG